MMNYGPSPMQELDQEMQATPVHHTGPGGPRERLTQGLEEQKRFKSQINPMAKGASGALGTINANLNKLRGIITDMDIIHMLKAKNLDDATIKELMPNVMESMERALGSGGSMEAVENKITGKGLSFGEPDFKALQQDIQEKNPSFTPTSPYKK